MPEFTITKKDLELKKSCPVCKSSKINKISSAYVQQINYLETSYCENCGLVFRSLRPKESWFKKSWNKRDKIQRSNEVKQYDQKIEKHRILTYDGISKFIKVFCRDKKNKIKCLDVGCGTGTGLHKFEEKGFEIIGIEPDPARARVGKTLYGAKIFENTVDKFNSKNKFDIITLIHSLEHIHNPLKTLKRICSFVKLKGLVYIEVPNFKEHVKDWNDIIYLGHLSNFSLKNLVLLGMQVNLLPVARFNMSHGPHLGILFRKEKLIEQKNNNNQDIPLIFNEVLDLYSKDLNGKKKIDVPIKVSVPTINDLSLSYKSDEDSIIQTLLVFQSKKISHKIRSIRWNPKKKIFEVISKRVSTNKELKKKESSHLFYRKSSYEYFNLK